MCYWREKVPGTYNADNRFPCFLVTEGEESKQHIYGLPSHEYPGLVKVGGAPVTMETRTASEEEKLCLKKEIKI